MVSEIGGAPLNIVKGADNGAQNVEAAKATKPVQPSSAEQGDKVSLTDLGSRLQELTAAVENLPVTDQKKVNELRSAIESGNYQVDAEAVAEKLNSIENLLGTADSGK